MIDFDYVLINTSLINRVNRSEKNKKKFDSKIQRLYHYNSTPPLHELETISTLKKHKRAQK